MTLPVTVDGSLQQNFDVIGQVTDRVRIGSGEPNGHVSAPVGTLYLRSDGGAGSTFYVKESGSGNTGWVAK